MSSADLGTMRRVALEQLTETATIRHFERTTDDWGHRPRANGTTMTIPCACGQITIASTSDPGIMRRTSTALLLPYDAPIAEGDEVLEVRTADGYALGLRGRIARVTRTSVLLLAEFGGA
jgi:hypothetical protein